MTRYGSPVALIAVTIMVLTACGSDGGGAVAPDVVVAADIVTPLDTAAAEDVLMDVQPEPEDIVMSPDLLDDGESADLLAPDIADDVTPDISPDISPDIDQGLPQALPFEFTRPQVGDPLTDEEITEFTRKITGMWKDTQYFRWVRFTAHGLDPSNEAGAPDYALWWQDYRLIKDGDVVTFQHRGRADNLTLRTSKVLNNAIAGYLMFGDEDMGWIAEQYCKGLAALSMAMEFGDEDPVVKYLQARAIFTIDDDYETVGGRKVHVDYGPMRRPDASWNAATINNPDNPYWGDIWFVNQRSKDDVPHMFRSVPMIMRLAEEAPDESVREAAELALEYLRGFAKDIVDQGYQIRTKFEDGVAVVPTEDNGVVKDLASFVLFDYLVPNGECNSKLTAALISYNQPLDNDCGEGDGGLYESFATTGHYFNYAIIRFFHIAAVANALMAHQDDVAYTMLEGLAARADRVLHDEELPQRDDPVWWPDAAAFLLASASSAGLPLTNEEARVVVEQYTITADHYLEWNLWDPWDDSVADGEYEPKPPRGVAVRPTEIAYLLEYCYSPLKNPAGARFVDCDVIRDPSRWGE